MITILHGDDITVSRNAYHAAKQLAHNPQTLEADKINLTDLTQILDGGGLFGEKQEVFLEQLVTKKKDAKELAAIAQLLTSHQKDHDIVLWESKELTKKQLESFMGAKVRLSKIPTVLFAFLDSLKPGNNQTMLKLFHQTLETSEVEMVFFMLIRHLRIMLALKDPSTAIDETKRMAPWQRGKLQSQATAFSAIKLRDIYQQLAKIDRDYKTGGNTKPLSGVIDFLLLET